ncbi:hypothetical protein Pan97_50200 [Bremerella volcania]|uniref:Uncharacterized protein n=1 Tax=Bremerella volcania TaxID=2527984 RepID=A0A518CFF0_9BACT|nr:hypothetical protein [Bremerella volcania]QDU77941.1 hypothetical protein Pan97_50200 [Bremerella volcania]
MSTRELIVILLAMALLWVQPEKVFAMAATIAAPEIPVEDKQQLTILTLKWDPKWNRFEQADLSWSLDDDGQWTADLPPGGYQVEIHGEVLGEKAFFRSPRWLVTTAAVDWVLELQPLRIELENQSEPLGIRHLKLRSFATTGEVSIHEGEPIGSVRLYTTTETQLDVTLIGENHDTIALGHVKIMPTHSRIRGARDGETFAAITTISTSGRYWYRRPVSLAEGNPPIASATLNLAHPRGELNVNFREGLHLVTNRPTFHMSYELNAESGRKLISRKCLVSVKDLEEFQLGGPLQVSAFAKILTRLPSTQEYRVGGILNDPSGIEIDKGRSDIHWSETFTMRGNQPLPKNPPDEINLGLLGNPLETVKLAASWEWASKHEELVTPAEFVKFRSANFQLDAPAGWRDRAAIYLHQLEHCRAVLKVTTGRKGPNTTQIRWRLNTHNAKAQVGGKQSWMSMPLNGLYEAVDPFGRPWFMVHEMLHTFNYNHGKPMTEQVNIGRKELGLTRWRIPEDLYHSEDVHISVIPTNLN